MVYQWLLDVCIKCKSFGHKGDKCGKSEEIVTVELVKDKGDVEKKGKESDTDWEVVRRRKGKMKVGEERVLNENVNMEVERSSEEGQKVDFGDGKKELSSEGVLLVLPL